MKLYIITTPGITKKNRDVQTFLTKDAFVKGILFNLKQLGTTGKSSWCIRWTRDSIRATLKVAKDSYVNIKIPGTKNWMCLREIEVT